MTLEHFIATYLPNVTVLSTSVGFIAGTTLIKMGSSGWIPDKGIDDKQMVEGFCKLQGETEKTTLSERTSSKGAKFKLSTSVGILTDYAVYTFGSHGWVERLGQADGEYTSFGKLQSMIPDDKIASMYEESYPYGIKYEGQFKDLLAKENAVSKSDFVNHFNQAVQEAGINEEAGTVLVQSGFVPNQFAEVTKDIVSRFDPIAQPSTAVINNIRKYVDWRLQNSTADSDMTKITEALKSIGITSESEINGIIGEIYELYQEKTGRTQKVPFAASNIDNWIKEREARSQVLDFLEHAYEGAVKYTTPWIKEHLLSIRGVNWSAPYTEMSDYINKSDINTLVFKELLHRNLVTLEEEKDIPDIIEECCIIYSPETVTIDEVSGMANLAAKATASDRKSRKALLRKYSSGLKNYISSYNGNIDEMKPYTSLLGNNEVTEPNNVFTLSAGKRTFVENDAPKSMDYIAKIRYAFMQKAINVPIETLIFEYKAIYRLDILPKRTLVYLSRNLPDAYMEDEEARKSVYKELGDKGYTPDAILGFVHDCIAELSPESGEYLHAWTTAEDKLTFGTVKPNSEELDYYPDLIYGDPNGLLETWTYDNNLDFSETEIWITTFILCFKEGKASGYTEKDIDRWKPELCAYNLQLFKEGKYFKHSNGVIDWKYSFDLLAKENNVDAEKAKNEILAQAPKAGTDGWDEYKIAYKYAPLWFN